MLRCRILLSILHAHVSRSIHWIEHNPDHRRRAAAHDVPSEARGPRRAGA
jgi:hypothetical protein